MLVQLRRLREYARVPLIAKPNAGMPITVGGKTVYDCTPEDFTAFVPAMLEAGVAVFGGCCGTTAAHIKALRDALRGAKFVPPAPQHTDRLADALDGDAPMVALRIDTWEDIDALTDVQYLLTKPLCLVCDDAELLEAALRVYQGRALHEGVLPEAALLPLSARYGLLI